MEWMWINLNNGLEAIEYNKWIINEIEKKMVIIIKTAYMDVNNNWNNE